MKKNKDIRDIDEMTRSEHAGKCMEICKEIRQLFNDAELTAFDIYGILETLKAQSTHNASKKAKGLEELKEMLESMTD